MTRVVIDRNETTWRQVEKWANERLTQLRAELEMPGTSPERTEGCRYAIRELLNLLKLPEPSNIPPISLSEIEY